MKYWMMVVGILFMLVSNLKVPRENLWVDPEMLGIGLIFVVLAKMFHEDERRS